jgi:hypothetical protein
LELPKQRVADWALEVDLTGDEVPDPLLWVRPESETDEPNAPQAELWYFPTGGDAARIWTIPGWLPSGAGCKLEPRLLGLGHKFALLTVQSRCTASLPARTATQAIVLLSPSAPRPLVLGLRVAEPAIDETLEISPSLGDRDGDGRVDPAVKFSLGVRGTDGTAQLSLGWLDRAAGASVDDGLFLSSVEHTLLSLESRAIKKAKAASVAKESQALRRLVGSICSAAATQRVWDYQGDGLRCSGLAKLSTRLAKLELGAALTLGDLTSAIHTVNYSSTWLAGIPAVEKEALLKRLQKSMSVVDSALPVAVSLRAKSGGAMPHYSPLMFADDGALLVMTSGNVVERVALDGTHAPLEGDAAKPWSLEVTDRDGRTFTGVVPACDRSELLLSIKGADGRLELAPVGWLAPRPGVCRNPTTWPFSVVPVGFTESQPSVLVDGACIDLRGTAICQSPAKLGPVIPGSPRSPDGRRLVLPTPVGPVVFGGAKPERWQNGGYTGKSLTDCVVANEGRAIACLDRGNVLLVPRSTGTL